MSDDVTSVRKPGPATGHNRTPTEVALISERQAATLPGVIEAVLDGIGLTAAQRGIARED